MNKPFESTRPYTDLVGRVLIAVIFLRARKPICSRRAFQARCCLW